MSIPTFLELNHNYDANEIMGEMSEEQMKEIVIWLNTLPEKWLSIEGEGFANWVSNFFITEEHIYVDYYTPGKDEWGFPNVNVLRYKNADGTMTLQQNTRVFER